jgi:hypothetical protein
MEKLIGGEKMLTRLTLNFPLEVREALQQMCAEDHRPPKLQVEYLVLTEARRRGLLVNSECPDYRSKANRATEVLADHSAAARK